MEPVLACSILDIIAAKGQPKQSDPNLSEDYWVQRIQYKKAHLDDEKSVDKDIEIAMKHLPRVSYH